MGNPTYTLYKRVQLSAGKWRYRKAAFHSNGKIKPHFVIVGGKEEKHEGHYFLAHDGKWIPVGEMFAEPGSRHITVAFADDREDVRSGPFHFLDERREKQFKKGFAECTAGKLPKSRFTEVDGEGVFKHSWAGIPTERNSLSYYALSLPEFAVPTRIEFKNPHSTRPYSCTVIRDDIKNRFVAYLGCRSSHASFDFLLQVNYRIDRGNFRLADYTDEHTTQPHARIPSYEDALMPDQRAVVSHFFSPESVPSQAAHNLPAQIDLFQPQKPNQRVKSQESKSKRPEKLPAKEANMSMYFDGAKLTDKQREVVSLRFEYGLPVAAIARRLGKDRSAIQERLAAALKKLGHTRDFERRAAKGSTNPE